MRLISVSLAFVLAGNIFSQKSFFSNPHPEDTRRPGTDAEKKNETNEIDENKMFSEGETVTPIENITNNKIEETTEKESIGFSGSVNSRNSYSMQHDWLTGNNPSTAQNSLSNYIQTNAQFEARLRKNMRAMVNVINDVYAQPKQQQKVLTDPSTGVTTNYNEATNLDFRVTEAFVDANINRAIYFRAGKQVLVWGRGFFWNPSDLINTELRSATDAFQFREGTYGLRTQVPIGSSLNFYSFTGVGSSPHAEDVLQAFKAEVAFKRAEIAVSTIVGQGKVPVFGFEASTRFLTLDWRAEATYARGDNRQRIDVQTFSILHPVTFQLRNQDVFKGVISFGRSFEMFDVADRLTINLEYFYNGAGYGQDNNVFAQSAAVKTYFVANGLYRANYYGVHYMGFFITYAKFLLSEMTLGLNGFSNLSDKTLVFSELLTYNPLFNLTLTWQNNIFNGASNGEYTVSGLGWYSEFSVRVSF